MEGINSWYIEDDDLTRLLHYAQVVDEGYFGTNRFNYYMREGLPETDTEISYDGYRDCSNVETVLRKVIRSCGGSIRHVLREQTLRNPQSEVTITKVGGQLIMRNHTGPIVKCVHCNTFNAIDEAAKAGEDWLCGVCLGSLDDDEESIEHSYFILQSGIVLDTWSVGMKNEMNKLSLMGLMDGGKLKDNSTYMEKAESHDLVKLRNYINRLNFRFMTLRSGMNTEQTKMLDVNFPNMHFLYKGYDNVNSAYLHNSLACIRADVTSMQSDHEKFLFHLMSARARSS
jgi:hypothetical protein